MNRMKKFASILLALVMALALAVPAMATGNEGEGETTPAAPTYKITIETEMTGHTYEAYQIFAGTLSENGETLSDVEWGSGVTNEVLTKYPQGAAAVAEGLNTVNVAQFAQEIEAYLSATVAGTSGAYSEELIDADGNQVKGYQITDLAPGYYLVKDKDNSVPGNSTYTTYILHIVTNADVTPKNPGVPTPDKTVGDKNDSTGAVDTNKKTADHDIGDDVPYTLKATLPNTVDKYESYKLVFHDKMSPGLSLNEDSIVVKVGEKELTKGTDYTVSYTEITGDANKTGWHELTVTIADVKADGIGAGNGSIITVDYTAKLTGNAVVIGNPGNPNELTLEFSNDPNHQGDGEPSTGTTPPVTAVVFTFKTVVNKVTQDGEVGGQPVYVPLEGAEFTLSKKIKGEDNAEDTWQTIATINNVTTFSFNGLDDGIYRLEETVVPDGYNQIDPIYFVIEAVHDETTKLVTSLEVYECDENGTKLTENKRAEFTVIATENNTYQGGSADVVNRKGATLPETGGIGTTIFYVLGGLLTVGAVVLLVTKKRMSAEDK